MIYGRHEKTISRQQVLKSIDILTMIQYQQKNQMDKEMGLKVEEEPDFA
jgi:hypothetical protein